MLWEARFHPSLWWRPSVVVANPFNGAGKKKWLFMGGHLKDVVARVTMMRRRNLARALSGKSFLISGPNSMLLTRFTSEVHKAVQIATRRAVALKRILMHNEKEGMPVTALREIKILKAMHHPCIVEILDMFVVRST